jgi:hypothetical protein
MQNPCVRVIRNENNKRWYCAPKVPYYEELDQDHLHPLREHTETNMSRPGIEPGPPASQASTPAKRYLNSLFCYYSESLHGCPSVWNSYTLQASEISKV